MNLLNELVKVPHFMNQLGIKIHFNHKKNNKEKHLLKQKSLFFLRRKMYLMNNSVLYLISTLIKVTEYTCSLYCD